MKVLISLCLLLGSCQVQQAPHSVVLSPARGTVNYIPLQAPLTPCSDMVAGCYWYVTNSGQGRVVLESGGVTINGSHTLAVAPGVSAVIFTDGQNAFAELEETLR